MAEPLYVGLDVGTSGVRGIAIDREGVVRGQAATAMPPPESDGASISQEPEVWWQATEAVLGELLAAVAPAAVAGVAVDGTSGTLLLADADGAPLSRGSMYNDASASALAARIKDVAPPESGAHGATSPLARLLALQAEHPQARFGLHQADWVAGRLLGRMGLSDENNALKLGYDPVARRWPDWMEALEVRRDLLPEVREPGTAFGRVSAGAAARFGLAPACLVVAGTTDGCASFLATGADAVGDGVTALGSTLTLKLLSDAPVFAARYGVYSHRLGERWLVGGASNTGGKALLRFFSAERMAELTRHLQPGAAPDAAIGRDWHPLPGTGERFPIADPAMTFEPSPRPADDVTFFQALLAGIAGVERRAYALLHELGGPKLRAVRTVGGGGANPAWTAMRTALLGVPMPEPSHLEAAYGAALLARRGSQRA